ncbi:zinc ribbon domain-containing protein YjdM [Acinetobacter boissieri]|uniref:Phosphonoacetate hydrolase n=1 Tax=Acinetobacter boissieri TaxID=1219383 RepID=A0A1G6H8A3_9GAMM|nr:zinc ribbon domain-containing protein YjdM [Acinetobacter boissieri]SDB90175.1 phosphonoacetate hydrolase [Acinetobacter boissieri]
MTLPACIQCKSEYTYQDGDLIVCPECAFEWKEGEQNQLTDEHTEVIVDSNGQVLEDGDFVTVIKYLKIKGSSSVVKVGTKVKVRLVHGASDGHNIDCKIPAIGAMKLKSEFVKKA